MALFGTDRMVYRRAGVGERAKHVVSKRETAWREYVDAMHAQLAAAERLNERLAFFVGSPPREPRALEERDWEDWSGLLYEAERTARGHRQALERYREARGDG